MDLGLRPNCSEISLLAPTNFAFGDDQVTSAIVLVFTLCMVKTPNVKVSDRSQPPLAFDSDLS